MLNVAGWPVYSMSYSLSSGCLQFVYILYTEGHPQLTIHFRGDSNGTENSPEIPGMTLQF